MRGKEILQILGIGCVGYIVVDTVVDLIKSIRDKFSKKKTIDDELKEIRETIEEHEKKLQRLRES